MNLAQQYIEDVLAGNIVANEFVKLAVQRHLDRLKKATELGFYFDEEDAEDAIDIISMMRHTKGEFAGQLFRMQGWQAFILWFTFGWKYIESGLRVTRTVYCEVSKKNGKTEFAAAVANYMTWFDGEFGAETYIGATKKEQAAICFTAIKTMVEHLRTDSEYLQKLIREPQRWNIHSSKTKSKIEPLAKNAKGDQGIFAHCGIGDEVHVMPDFEVIDNIESSMVARSQPLLFLITTAGTNIESDCYKLRTTCIQVLQGIKEDDSLLPMVFCFDEGDDWEDESLWQKPIPNLNISVKIENIRQQLVKAKNMGQAKLRSFKTLNLNMWHASNFDTWLPDTDWQQCEANFSRDELKGRLCFGGLDMAATSDVATYALFFPAMEEGEKHRIIWKYYLPNDAIDEKEQMDKVRYRDWATDGWFTLIPSNVLLSETGRTTMRDDIAAEFLHHDVQAFGYDRWNAFGLVSDLIEMGLSEEIIVPFGMGYKSMSTPMSFLESWAKQGEIEHQADPVIRWMVSNCVVATDGENIKPDRKKSTNKIDGVVAGIIAVGQYLIWQAGQTQQRSIYDNAELWNE